MRSIVFVALFLLTACHYNVRLPYIYAGEPGVELQPGESASFKFFTNDSRADTGIALQSGVDYAIDIKLLSNWSDGNISSNEDGEPLDARGFADSLMPREFYNHLKRSGSHRWFELMLYQDNCPSESLRGYNEMEKDPETGQLNYRAVCSGKMSMHVNDTWGFYGNNTGYANITITRKSLSPGFRKLPD